jgi:hypothetical protein
LPDEPFQTGREFRPGVDRRAQICVRANRYSVPVYLVGRRVRVLLHSDELLVFDGADLVARHERLVAKNGCRLELDHYLEVLLRKPGALPGATALEQAQAAGKFPAHGAWWAAVRKVHGDGHRPATAASTCSASMSWAVSNSTNAALTCCSRF